MLVASLAGCTTRESRTIERLPAPVFREPDAIWASTRPEPARAAADIEAAWRNHVYPARTWRWIVVHHSSSHDGGARRYDQLHRGLPRNWDELGYHFVIGNGTDTPDGQVEVGGRWVRQKHGAHTATPSHQFNDYGVGICLVGDCDAAPPTPAQKRALLALCEFLCREHDISPSSIVGHKDAQAREGQVTTTCPGKFVSVEEIRRAVEAVVRP